MYSNKSATPFATANAFGTGVGNYYLSSTEYNDVDVWMQNLSNGNQSNIKKNDIYRVVRATRRSTI
jgi:hypothetical protein